MGLYDCEEDMGIEIEEVPISQPSELPTLEMVPRIEEEGDREMWAIYVLFSVTALHCFVGFKNVQVNLKKRTRDAVGLRNDCGEMCLKKARQYQSIFQLHFHQDRPEDHRSLHYR